MKTFLLWQKWLLIVCIFISVFGVLIAFLSGTPLFSIFNRQIDPAFWGVNAADAVAGRFQQWLYGVWGATIAGWGIVMSCVVHRPFKNKERWAWNALALGILVWFVLDTGLSIIHKVYFNVAFNTTLLVLAGLPMAFTISEFNEQPAQQTE